MKFFSELKRRNVYKVAVTYGVVGWLVIQVCATIVPALHLPEGLTTALVVLVLLGFPIALVLAWAFEMTPEGMKRTENVSPNEKLPQWSKRKFAALVVTIALLAASLLVFQLVRSKSSPTTRPSEAATATDKSIAVLPLVNESGDAAQEYFSDGLTDELINGLGKISQLRVIGRNSSFYFKGKANDARAIGHALGVANLLEGSVRTLHDRVRIAVQLVNAADGSQRWSDTYDRELKDIFAVQEEIAKTVANQLRVKLVGATEASSSKPSNANLAAYNVYLQGKFYFDKGNSGAAAQAITFFDEAIRLDPNYAEAYNFKARALNFIANGEGLRGRENFEKARAAVRSALALKPNLATAHASLAYIDLYADWNVPAAEAEVAMAREKDAQVLNILAGVRLLEGRSDECIALRQEALRLEPLHTVSYTNIAQDLMRAGRWDEAALMLRKALELQPSIRWAHGLLAFVAVNVGDLDMALREAELEPPGSPRDGMLACVRFARGERQQADQALQQLIVNFGEDNPVTIAQVYAVRREPESVFQWLERAYERRQPSLIFSLGGNPAYRPYYSDPRFAALCNKVGVPVPK